MFTGLIESLGTSVATRKVTDELDLDVALRLPAGAVRVGDSIALSGVCCTVSAVSGQTATFRLSAETLARTWFGELGPGRRVNVERPLRVGDPLGGHIVQGHVDGVGEVLKAVDPEAGGELRVRVPAELERYCVEKGSLAVDGVSLTIAQLEPGVVRIAVIPHTAAVTTLGSSPKGTRVNLEVDILAKYVERLLPRP